MGELEHLEDLVHAINEEHRSCERAVNTALDHALRAGDLLFEAKGRCPHGTWQTWLGNNFEGSVRTAQAYMRVATNREVVEAAKAQSSALLSLGGALKALSAPDTKTGGPPLERYPTLRLYADDPQFVEELASRLDRMPRERALGFEREYAIMGYVFAKTLDYGLLLREAQRRLVAYLQAVNARFRTPTWRR